MAVLSESKSIRNDKSISYLGVKAYQTVLIPIYELLALLNELKESHLPLTGINYQSLLNSTLECTSNVQSSIGSLHKLLEVEVLRINRVNYISDDSTITKSAKSKKVEERKK